MEKIQFAWRYLGDVYQQSISAGLDPNIVISNTAINMEHFLFEKALTIELSQKLAIAIINGDLNQFNKLLNN